MGAVGAFDPHSVLNKLEKTLNKTYTALKSFSAEIPNLFFSKIPTVKP